ncbi:hypothetical protein [Rhizobium leguminosarum]|uniref:hypothetical protein n=1 Tax=Rhizobium leguminosarum TaxID=384 RepID=UPI001C91B090|nr:hypothetical protein [Rhizobium leguminosarum]MBY2916163.1 hypothetical protein [Rhizobium leguminosarum]MBY2971398.1 hypothetical protein [Rhizobium leguminosarum]MBY2978800.1 hypothetical protein [Rhizobium leguminosarum]MBY3007351.1 hypothetical protein [Rhizobium leguminosarum]
MTTWCDKLASTPTIGFLMDTHFAPAEAILGSMAPLLDTWQKAEQWNLPSKPEFQVTGLEAFKVDVQHDDGFTYSIDQNKVSVQFQHRMKYRHTSGGLPVAELISKAMVYSDLLHQASDKIMEVAMLLPKDRQRSIMRIGVVSTTFVSLDDVPPGIRKFIDYVSKPWAGDVQSYQFQITSTLEENELIRDRCLHTITRSDDNEQLLTIMLDYQRYLAKKVPLERNAMQRAVSGCRDAALAYFEELAVGDRFDEYLIEAN